MEKRTMATEMRRVAVLIGIAAAAGARAMRPDELTEVAKVEQARKAPRQMEAF